MQCENLVTVFTWAEETVTSVEVWLNFADNWMQIDEKKSWAWADSEEADCLR